MNYDVIIIGAGASGLMCAAEAARRGRAVLVLDHAARVGNKIRIAGGGKCNFTNREVTAAHYVSRNPHFCKSALSRYPAEAFLAKLLEQGIEIEERKHGQLFCQGSAEQIVTMFRSECDAAGVRFQLECAIEGMPERLAEGFQVKTNRGCFTCVSLVVATGGLSYPQLGATGLGHDIARTFGLRVVETAPALDGFTFSDEDTAFFRNFSGIALECAVTCNGKTFRENVLFTHQGLSGPSMLQASLHWNPGAPLVIDLLPGLDLAAMFLDRKKSGSRATPRTVLSETMPARLAEGLAERHGLPALPLPQVSEKALQAFAASIHGWKVVPARTIGYKKAEVTRGGVDTDELSSKTMEARNVPGLFFVGEVVDVTGWLGGYNLQWAWSSGWAAGQAV